MTTEPVDGDDVRIRDGLVAGAEWALAEAYDVHCSIVFGVAMRITQDRGAAEDVTQEVFLDLWRFPERFDPARAPLRGWLCMISRRRAIDWHRRRPHREVPADDAPESSDDSFEDELLAATAYKQVRRAVGDLRAPHKQAIMMAFYDGLTYREVAKSLNIPEGTAKARMRTALRKIGERLVAEGF